MAKKEKRERFTSPKGRAVYPRVDGKPDTKFDKGGVWQVQLALKGKEAKEFAARVDGWMEQAKDKAEEELDPKKLKKGLIQADPPYQPEVDKDDNETGATLFRFKLKATGEKRDGTTYNQHVTVLKADLNPFPNSSLGSGSVIKCGFEVSFFTMQITAGSDKGKYTYGVSLKLRVVQVIEYKPYVGGGSPDSFGMEAEEGFTGDEAIKEEEETEDEEEDEDEDEPTPAKGKKGKKDEEEEEEEQPAPKKGKKASKDDDF